MASNTPDGASGEGHVHNYQALKKILRLAEEIYPLVEPGRKELEYMIEEQSKCTTLIKELQNGKETLKEKLKDLELVSVSKEEHTQLKSKYQQLASEAKRQITKQKQRLIYLGNLSTGAEQQVELLQQEVSEAMSREEQLHRLLEQKEEELVKAKRVTEEIRLNGINITNTSWNKRRGFDDLAEATNREAELNMQVTKLRKRLTDVENELNETKTRLSRTMGDKLTDNNPAITDLSDKNRPVKLAERYSELYDNEWTDSFEIIHKVYRDERNTVAQLLKILMDVAEFCRTESQKQFKKMRAAIAGENTGDTPLPKPVEKQLRDCRKVMAEKAGYTLYEMYEAKLRQSTSSVAREALIVPGYLKEAFTLCWQMCVQDPPVVFDEPPKHGDTLKSELYKSYTRGGACVDFLVWPALYQPLGNHCLVFQVDKSGLRNQTLLKPSQTADYIVTGTWSANAATEAQKYGKVNYVLPKTKTYTNQSEWKLSTDASYVYYCDSETIHASRKKAFANSVDPDETPHDAASHQGLRCLLKEISFGLIFAGAQKNIGCAGCTVVIIREDLIGQALPSTPSVFCYTTQSANNSLFNTPPTYSIYIMGLVSSWKLEHGGVEGMEENSRKKSDLIYDVMDNSSGFFVGPINKNCRSRTNVTFRIGSREGCDVLEKKFLDMASKCGMKELKGHRSVGGIRASLYNAVTAEETKVLADFMKDFFETHRN
ncbi:hypothetical protein DPMN_120808 [Dreissena polymorpha]|uniref:phosphoserine transaminase n=1 Tax=Dreissena polymorpha TaxID=45954 RepID=A0A9D4GSB1_DREPO|nr:hypothetical protein DPMN_120808 [Dreissena polymorpha]